MAGAFDFDQASDIAASTMKPASFISLAALALLGCAQVEPQLQAPVATDADLQAEIEFQLEASLERLRHYDRRVVSIFFKLQFKNVDLCSKSGPSFGMVLHHPDQYGPETRSFAERHFKLDRRPGILAIAPGGPADLAGLREDDRLIAVNGEAVSPSALAPGDAATYASLEKVWLLINRPSNLGGAVFTVVRGDRTLELPVQPLLGCGYASQVLISNEFNAWADGQRVTVTTGMIRYAVNDNQLASLLGHELAHNILEHQKRLSAAGPAGAILGSSGALRSTRLLMEREADYLGLYLAARAGFDISGAGNFWREFGADYPESRYTHWTHPGARERASNLTATIAEIQDKQARGLPLRPEPAR